MREYGSNINLPSLDNLFSSEQERQDAKLEKIQILPLTELHPFRNHPFQVRDDDEMDKMVDSVKEYGVMTPAIVRPRKDGGYEIVAGHRRCHASQRAGVETMPCIVRDMDDDTAIILMVDSNCQREHILPSEKAKAYEMKLEAIRRKAGRPSKENSRQVVGDFESADKPLMESHYTAPCPTIKDLWMALNNQRDKRSKEIALALRIFATGSMQAFAQPTNVDMSNRLICFNIQSLGEQLKPVAMLSMLEYINTAVMSNERNDPKAATWVYFDEIYLLLRDSLSANFLYTSWKRFRKYNAYATGITQNVQDCLTNDTAYAMLANSEFVVMLRQTKDIDSVVELYGLSEPQRKYLLLAQPGEGIIKMGNSLIPFNNPQPKDTKTYKLLTTKPGEME